MEVIEIIAALILCIPVGSTLAKFDNNQQTLKYVIWFFVYITCLIVLLSIRTPQKCIPCEKASKYELIQEPVYRKIK
jgi:hypothetical protein